MGSTPNRRGLTFFRNFKSPTSRLLNSTMEATTIFLKGNACTAKYFRPLNMGAGVLLQIFCKYRCTTVQIWEVHQARDDKNDGSLSYHYLLGMNHNDKTNLCNHIFTFHLLHIRLKIKCQKNVLEL